MQRLASCAAAAIQTAVAVVTTNTFAYIRYITLQLHERFKRFMMYSKFNIILYSHLTIVSVRTKRERRAVITLCAYNRLLLSLSLHADIIYLYDRKFASDLFFSHRVGRSGRHPPSGEYLGRTLSRSCTRPGDLKIMHFQNVAFPRDT